MITLLPFGKADFDTLISWADTEETLLQFAGRYFSFPLTHQQLASYIIEANRHIYKVVYQPTQTHIGHAEIFVEGEDVVLLCRIIIGDKTYRGKGFGQQIVKQLLQIAFTKLSAETAELNVFDWNTTAIKCYEKQGFTFNNNKAFNREINGKTWKAVNMQLAKEKWQQLLEKL